jgi:glycosidase
MRLPGPPIIYYGTEIGLTQRKGKADGLESSREPMRWGDDQDRELLAFYRARIAEWRARRAQTISL